MSKKKKPAEAEPESESIPELAITGDLTDAESDITQALLEVPPRGDCIIYFDTIGGSPYSALSIMNLIRLRGLRALGIITGECLSAGLLPLAACERRYVTKQSVLLFHPMKWESGDVDFAEAKEWSRHFGLLEDSLDDLLSDLFGLPRDLINSWTSAHRYVSGEEFADTGAAEMIDSKIPLRDLE